jgi:hypothetical protein
MRHAEQLGSNDRQVTEYSKTWTRLQRNSVDLAQIRAQKADENARKRVLKGSDGWEITDRHYKAMCNMI